MGTQVKLLSGSNLRFMGVSILVILLSVFFAQGVGFSSVPGKNEITRGEFIEMLAENHSENSLLPKDHSQMSRQALFFQVAKSLKNQGINVLDNKSSDDLLSQQEFVRITYAFAGGPKNKSLFEQKLFLKDTGIIFSAISASPLESMGKFSKPIMGNQKNIKPNWPIPFSWKTNSKPMMHQRQYLHLTIKILSP